jgi:hypothetical protein
MNTERGRVVPKGTPPDQALSVFKSEWGDNVLKSVDAKVATLPAGAPLKLLIFVHGGLNTYGGAMKRVGVVLAAVATGTDPTDPDHRPLATLHTYYPLFINWNSDLLGSVYDDIFELRFGERRAWAGYPTALPEIGTRLTQGVLNAPSSLGLEVSGVYNGLNVNRDDNEWPHCRMPALGVPTNEGRAANAFVFVLFYPTRILTAPVIQGLGAPAWDTMKRRAELVMAPRQQVTKRDPQEIGGGRLFIESLRERTRRTAAGAWWAWTDASGQARLTPLEITVVGHSMGTMVLNHLLETLPDVPIRRIVYLAAADTIQHVYGAVVPYLDRNPNAEFWSFSLAETNEALEVDTIDVIPRGSLLVWIDHFFQRISAPSDRTFGRASNLREYVEVPRNLGKQDGQRQRFFLVKFGRTKDDPSKHGDMGKVWPLDRALATAESGICHP